jgi:hypothetical protein
MRFRASYDFQSRTVTGYVNDLLIGTIPFTSGRTDQVGSVLFFMASANPQPRPDGNVMYYDNVSVTVVPEPHTAVSVMVGFLAYAWHRRRKQ